MYTTLIMFQIEHWKCDNGVDNQVVHINVTDK